MSRDVCEQQGVVRDLTFEVEGLGFTTQVNRETVSKYQKLAPQRLVKETGLQFWLKGKIRERESIPGGQEDAKVSFPGWIPRDFSCPASFILLFPLSPFSSSKILNVNLKILSSLQIFLQGNCVPVVVAKEKVSWILVSSGCVSLCILRLFSTCLC